MSRLATQPARASGEFALGGDLPVVRLGYGTMQIPGPGVWGPPRDHDEVIRVLRRYRHGLSGRAGRQRANSTSQTPSG